MNPFPRRQFLAATAATAAALVATRAGAQSARPTRIVIGFAPGGGADSVARQLSARMRFDGGGTGIVDSRPGAGGRLAVELVKNAEGDGRTLLVTAGSIMTIYPSVYTRLSYDPIKDFKAVTTLATVPYGIVVGPLVPDSVRTLKDFAAWAKANRDKSFYGSPGSGTTPHYVGQMFAKAGGFDYTHTPYKGGMPALQDVMGGQIASSVLVISEVVPSAQAGKVRVLAVSSPQRLPQLPDVPTFAEAGYGDLTSQEWFGVFAPAATPDATVEQLARAAAEAYHTAETQAAMEKLAFTVNTNTPKEFAELLRNDIERWAPVVRETGFRLDE